MFWHGLSYTNMNGKSFRALRGNYWKDSIALGLCETADMVREVKHIGKAASTDSAFITD